MSITDKQIQAILDDMVIIVDTREQKNQHILDYFKANDIAYKIEKLDSCDYSFYLPNHNHLGLDRLALIEKKNSLDEIAGNFTKGRERFEREFERVLPHQHVYILIENMTWKKLFNGTYRSKFPAKSFMASLLTFSIRYDIKVYNSTPAESPVLIYNILKYELREKLNKMQKGE